MRKQAVNHIIRFPPDLYAKLRKLAELENRSINGQVLTAVKAFIDQYEARHGVIQPDPDKPDE